MTCANCSEPALYVYDARPLRPTAYCAEHLPAFLRKPARAGVLTTTDAYDDTRRSALAALRPAVADEAPVDEPEAPVVEEQPSEAEVSEAPAPRKRRRKKTEAPADEEPQIEAEEQVEEPEEA